VTLTPCPNTIEARSRDKAGNYSAIASSFVTYTPPNTAPTTPTNISPTNAAKNLAVTPLLQASAFRDLDCVGDTHAASQWRRLAERCVSGQQTLILESIFLQNSVMPAFIYDAPADVVTGLVDTILGQVAPAEPFLLYLRPADLAAAVARIHRTRGPEAKERNVTFVENSRWARRHDLRGPGAVAALYEDWEAFVDTLHDRYPFPKLMVTDPQQDWPAARARIGAAIRP